MPKRPWRPREGDSTEKPPKRIKVVPEAPTSEEVHSARQLRKLLAFEQDLKKARHGFQSFRLFLDKLNHGEGDLAAEKALLKEYLEAVKPKRDDDDAIYFSDIFDTWSFADRTKNEGAVAAAIVVLGHLLSTAAGSLDTLPHAAGLVRTLLREEPLQLLSHALAAERYKAFLINPALRLVREALVLDGGAFAARIFRARGATLASLGRNMEIVPEAGEPDDPKRPAVRAGAVRVFLACLRGLDADARRELLAVREVWSHLTFLVARDPPALVAEIFETLRECVALDARLPRKTKQICFGLRFLERVAGLYNSRLPGSEEIAASAHEFLMLVCAGAEAGVLHRGTGLYPQGVLEDADRRRGGKRKTADVGLDQVGWIDKFREEVPVANGVLADFLPKLRPWASERQCELLLAVFAAAPELVARYFLATRSFTFDPKLSMTWIGYGALLFRTVQLPVPPFFGERAGYPRAPPPTSILIDNILPRPLEQKVLVRSLALKGLMSFFVVRLLIAAMQKMEVVLKMHREAGPQLGSAWSEGARKLVDAFCQRLPEMKLVVTAYKATPEDNILHREAISRLLLLYYDVVPQMALSSNFDVLPFLINALNRMNKEYTEEKDRGLIGLELEHLLTIAGYSPGARWFSKMEGMQVGTFTALLRLTIDSSAGLSVSKVSKILEFVAQETQLITPDAGLRALMLAIKTAQHEEPDISLDPLWNFLDNCFSRCATASLKFLETLQDLNKAAKQFRGGNDSYKVSDVSLITVAIVDQLPFATKSASEEDMQLLSQFTTAFLAYSVLSGKTGALLDLFCQKVSSPFGSDLASAEDMDIPQYLISEFEAEESIPDGEPGPDTNNPPKEVEGDNAIDDASLEALLDLPIIEDMDHSVLSKWVSKPVEDLVEDNFGALLAQLLTSEHTSIRKEALTNLLKMAARIRDSAHDDRDQVWLLLSELAESSRERIDAGPVPSAYAAFATHGLAVLRSPLHPLYARVNRFLTKRPTWPAGQVPLAEEVLAGEPSEEDRYYAELAWFLAYTADCLRTEADLAAFRRRRLLEGVLALGSNPGLRAGLRTRLLRVVYRATRIPGGSTTLVTRFGIVGWLEGQMALAGEGEEARVLKALMRRVWETCDRERVGKWSRGGVEEAVSRP